jgi:hypothetical protein
LGHVGYLWTERRAFWDNKMLLGVFEPHFMMNQVVLTTKICSHVDQGIFFHPKFIVYFYKIYHKQVL